MCQLLFLLVLYIHVMACLWFFVVSIEKKWVPNQDFIYLSTTIFDENVSTQYWVSVYHAVLLFGVNEMASRTDFELFFSSFIMLFSAMVNANIFGTMAVLVQDLNKKTVKFSSQIDTATTAMSNMRLPFFLQSRVSEFLHFTQGTQDQ